MRLKDKVAIVTGGGCGMGYAVCQRYAREGAKVAIAEVNQSTGRAAEEAIRTAGGEATFFQTDVTSEGQIIAMVEATRERYGRVDTLVNNAGIALTREERRAHELTNELWDLTMNVNLRGYWLCSKYVLPWMLKQGSGSIIFIASPTGMLGFSRLTAYSTSKGGVLGLMRAMAVDYAPDHIRVNAIVPGTMDTPMNAEDFTDPQERKKWAALAPAGRLGVADDISGMAVFLATDESDYCVGGIYMVDGGYTAV